MPDAAHPAKPLNVSDAPDGPVPTTLVRPPPPVPLTRRLADLVAARLPASRRAVMGAVAGAAAVALVAITLVRAPAGRPPEADLPRAQRSPVTASAVSPGAASGTADTGPPAAGELVHVAGAVANPGVHQVPAGARVIDAVAAAGGPTANADLDALDLAAKVSDGQRVYVPRRGEVPPGAVVADPSAGGGDSAAGPVNVNTATVTDLDRLPGVGPSLANAIVEYRQRHGAFHRVDDLLEVPGIGDAKLASLRPKVTV